MNTKELLYKQILNELELFELTGNIVHQIEANTLMDIYISL